MGIKESFTDLLATTLRRAAVDVWKKKFKSLDEALVECAGRESPRYYGYTLSTAVKGLVGDMAQEIVREDPELRALVRRNILRALKESFGEDEAESTDV